MATMRVLSIIDTVGAGGGAEQLVAALAPEIRRRGIDLEVAALFDWPEDLGGAMVEAGVPVHRIHAPADRVSAASLAGTAKLARHGGFDLFWGHLRMGNVHARLAQMASARVASVMTLHNQGPLAAPPTRVAAKMGVAVEGRLLGGATMRVAVSKAAARDHHAFFGWQGVEVAHNGIDVARLRALADAADPAAVRAEHGIPADAFLVACPARYIRAKGQPVLLGAVQRMRRNGAPVHLVLCGTGPMQRTLGQDAVRLGIADRVTITGNLDQAALFPLLAAADAVALPSERESFGLAAAEALAIGVPAVLSRIDGFLELVGDSGGARLVSRGDAAAFAEAIEEIRNHPEQARAMAARGAAHVESHFSLAACADRWAALLAAAAGRI